jgi:hypothetical protein
MNKRLFLAVLMAGFAANCFADEPGVWITGEIFTSAPTNGQFLFLADKPIKDNPGLNVVLLGTTRAAMNLFLPAYAKAADKHTIVRLFGVLQKITPPSNAPPNAPNVQFIAWKFHLPSDPDELPPSDRIPIDSNNHVEGYTISTNRPSNSVSKTTDYSSLIVGSWQNLDTNPPRLINFNKDGTWSLHYSDGKSPDQNGTWQINGTTLVRNYSTGFKRNSEIQTISDSEMILSDVVEGPAGSFVHFDHYKRLPTPSLN